MEYLTDQNQSAQSNHKDDCNDRSEIPEINNEDPLDIFKSKKPVDADGNGPYIPGSLTDPDKRHESYDRLVKDAVEDIHGPQEDIADKFWRKVAENAKTGDGDDKNMKQSDTPKLPVVNVSQNFNFARKMHVGNLEHQPLPDTLGYKKMTKVGEHRDSDIIVKPYAIGWKGYGASGPTCCTKLRVHRPKTSDPVKTSDREGDKQRPSTSAPNLGSQSKKPMSLMDLAIYWDFRPDDHKKEPRPSKHIDGSNGSIAPAVFTMVRTPKEEETMHIGHTNSIFNQNVITDVVGRHPVPYFEKDLTKEKRKDACDVQYCSQHTNGNSKVKSGSSSRRSSAQSLTKQCDGIHGCGTPSYTSRNSSESCVRPEKLQTVKTWGSKKNNETINHSRQSLESYEKTPLALGKLHQSSPKQPQKNLQSKSSDGCNNSLRHKNCLSCNGAKIPIESKIKEEYKFAFKAGNPNSMQTINSSQDSKGVKMPKMRHPYTKKSYTIPTLAPPFSIWRDASATGYPEHWRLASVYQHAYKPPEQRRKPLISNVYQ